MAFVVASRNGSSSSSSGNWISQVTRNDDGLFPFLLANRSGVKWISGHPK